MKQIPDLHLKALEAVKHFQKAESSLLKIIQEVDQAKIFLQMGYTNLFLYLTEALKLNEAQAYAYSTVSRKSREVPALQIAVENGLSLYKAQRIVPVLTKENQEEWISKAKALPKAHLEKAVAEVSPATPKRDHFRAVSKNRVRISADVSDEVNEMLKRALVLVSNQKKKNASLEDCLWEVLEMYLERKDPLKKAKRVLEKKLRAKVSKAGLVSIPPCPGKVIRRQIPTEIKHQVLLRDQMKCSFKARTGKACGSERHLEIHHLKPWSIGGDHSPSNLQTLCHSHHQHRHK